jgi:hypothetical protein
MCFIGIWNSRQISRIFRPCIKHFFVGGNYPRHVLSEGKGDPMLPEDIIFLHPVEAVTLDIGAFQSSILHSDSVHAMAQADDLFEDFIVCLSAIEAAWSSGEFDRLSSQTEMMVALCESLGLTHSAAVARQLTGLIRAGDDVALAAVVARMVRVGEASLASVLEFAYRKM